MRLAIVSDVHGDVHALRDALRQIDRMGCDRVVCAGGLLRSPAVPFDETTLIGHGASSRVDLSPGLFGVPELPSCSFAVFKAADGKPAGMTEKTLT